MLEYKAGQIYTPCLEVVPAGEECVFLISAERMRKNNHCKRGSDVY